MPIPRAKGATTTSVKPAFRRSARAAYRTSWNIPLLDTAAPDLLPLYLHSSAASSSANNEIEVGSFGKCPKIPISRQKRDSTIDAALRDQCITKARLRALL